MRRFYIRLWKLLDRYPLRVKTLLAATGTALLAGLILWTLLAGTVAPAGISLFEKFFYFFGKFHGTHFVPFVILSSILALAAQGAANKGATVRLQDVLDLEEAGKKVPEEKIIAALNELAVFPFKAAFVSLLLWTATAIAWWVALSVVAVLPWYVNLFISVGLVCEAFIGSPYQYFIFKLQIERDYFRLLKKLSRPYFPEQTRFLTIRRKLGGSITVLVAASLLALFLSNMLLAWEGVRKQTADVGRGLLDVAALGITNIKSNVEKEARDHNATTDYTGGETRGIQWVDGQARERAGVYLKEVEAKLGRAYLLFDSSGQPRLGTMVKTTPELLEMASERIQKAPAASAFIGDEGTSSRDLFLAVPLGWVDGTQWFLGTFYTSEAMFANIRNIALVSILLIAVMIAVGLLTAYLIATDTSDSLNSMAEAAGKASEGNLSETQLQVVSDDEVGVLARSLTHMFGGFREIVTSIGASSKSLDLTTTDIADVAQRVSSGAETQVESARETTQNMGVLSASIKSIGENVEVLAKSAEESSASIFQMGATVEGVAGNVAQLFDAVDDSTSVITEMVASIRQVADSVKVLNEITAGTVRAMEGMGQASQRVEADANDTRKLSLRTAEDAQAGALAVQQTIEGIQEIRKSVGAAHQVIQTLNQSADSIGNILNYISDVADQTNLLSLNAGIIAAQAGEHGKGFAVIAKEVSTLAERTARYTREIERLIESVQKNTKDAIVAMEAGSQSVDTGVDLSRRAGEALQQILTSAEQSSQRVASIASTAAEQTQSARRVSSATAQASEMSQQIMRATQEQNTGSERIIQSGEKMRSIAALVKKTTQEQAANSKQITKAIENINDMVRYINDAQREETATCERVGGHVEKINRVTLQNFDYAMNLDGAVDMLRRQSAALKAQLARFRLQAGGNGDGGRQGGQEKPTEGAQVQSPTPPASRSD